jgi:hypothetical protein
MLLGAADQGSIAAVPKQLAAAGRQVRKSVESRLKDVPDVSCD